MNNYHPKVFFFFYYFHLVYLHELECGNNPDLLSWSPVAVTVCVLMSTFYQQLQLLGQTVAQEASPAQDAF